MNSIFLQKVELLTICHAFYILYCFSDSIRRSILYTKMDVPKNRIIFPEFVPDEGHVRRRRCSCSESSGCSLELGQSENDITDNSRYTDIEYMQAEIKRIQQTNFLTKPYHQYSDIEKQTLKKELVKLCIDKDGKFRQNQIDKLLDVVMMFYDWISIKDFLILMDFTLDRAPKIFYKCLEHVLDYSSWRDPSQLLNQVKIFFEDFNGDINHSFIHRHDLDKVTQKKRFIFIDIHCI